MMAPTRSARAPRVARYLLLATLALAAAGAREPASAAAVAPRAAIERRFEAAMSAQRWEQASALADSLVRLREARERLPAVDAAAVLDSLGRRLFMAGDPQAWAAAEPVFRAGLARRERVLGPEAPAVAANLATLATLLDYLGRWDEAIPLAERAVAIRARALGERRPETAASLRQLGLLRFQLGDYAGAAEPLERSQATYDTLGPGFEARAADGHNNLGELARVRDRLDEAERHFRLGLDLASAHLAPDDPTRLALANNLAGLFKDRGRYDEAEPLLESALATLETAGADPEALATTRLNLAEVRRLQGRPAQAAPLYARALDEARRALGERHPGLVPFLNQAAVCAQELRRFAQAESLYSETGTVLEATLGPEHPLLAQNLVDLARFRMSAYAQTSAAAAAETDSLLARALRLRERGLGPAHPDVALVLLEQARARALEPGDPDAPAAPLARAIAILDAGAAYPDARLDAYAQRARWHARRGERSAAIGDMAVALAAMDSLRASRGGGDETRAAYVAGQLDLVDRMVGWQLEAGETEAALATHERGRARVLLDQIAASGVDLRAGIPAGQLAPLADAERSAEAHLASAHRAIQDARGDPALSARERLETLAALEARRDSAGLALALARRRIEDASPLWRNVLGSEGRVASASQLREDVVPRDGLLLVYHVGSAASHVFALPPRGAAEAYPLTLDPEAAAVLGEAPGPLSEAAFERIVGGTPASAGRAAGPGIVGLLGGTRAGAFLALPLRSAAGPDSFELRLHALWRTLVPEALRHRVLAARHAVVVPDGALQSVAFEALVTRPRGDGAKATRYWLDDGPAIAYGPSASSLRSLALRSRPGAAPPAGHAQVLSVSDVAFATPLVRGRAWSPLPGTALESRALAAAFGPANVEVLSGAAAREPAVRAALPDRRFVHLATHGFTDVSPERLLAGLVLAPPPAAPVNGDDDGVLDLFEIHRLPLGCELAMLSACETAKGPRVAGEGSFALSRAFLAAGARRVVASLWMVDDRAAPVVVQRLFESIAAADRARRPCDFAAALRAAKREVRRDPRWSDPFYWAPFVLNGR